MLDIDYSPGVFFMWICVVVICPAIYGIFFVDANWKKHAEKDDGDDVFN
jgi:hypothetical protein